MTGEELKTRLYNIFGYGSVSKFARGMGMTQSTVSKWITNVHPVPAHVEATLELLETAKKFSQIPKRFR